MNNSLDRRPLRISYTVSWTSSQCLPLPSPGASSSAKTPENLAAKGSTICRTLSFNFP